MTTHLLGPAAFDALARQLEDLAMLIAALTTEHYTARNAPRLSGGIGGHVRHCLDHVLAFERAVRTGRVDYDDRVRGTAVEHDRDVAVAALRDAADRLVRQRGAGLERSVAVSAMFAPGAPPLHALSTLGRELSFVISHTIHHSAHIALLADRLGVCDMPVRFGFAPATPVAAGAA